MIESNRRDFVKTCAGLAVAATVPDLRFPTDPRKRLAVASYPFRALLDAPHNSDRDRKQPGIALKDFAAMVADKFGIHNIEPLGSHFPSTDAAYLREFRTAVEKAGSHVVNIPVDVGASFYDPDASAREKAVANGKKWVDIAAAVGSPGVRVHMQPAEGAKPDLGRASESLKSIADHSGGKGIITTLENDDLVSEDAFFLVKVIEKVNSPYLRALPDFANSMLSGDEKFNYDAVAAMFRHATNIAHVKDSEVSEGKVVRVDVGKTFGIAKAAGYRGYYSMEWEGQGGPYDGTALLIRESLKYL
jgi:sugar phosphate isomerase/epimerase